jgi:serine/threonine protein phosphatase 1
MRKFVIGDIHGGYRGLVQVLERVNFDYENDMLISLGDVTDGWSETAEAIEHLITIKNLVYIKGNHDEWSERFLLSTLKTGPSNRNYNWYRQGGRETYNSYLNNPELAEKHVEFLRNAKLYHIDEENRLFLHAGFDVSRPIDDQEYMDVGQRENTENAIYYWDRSFWNNLRYYAIDNDGYGWSEQFKEVYIGHTPTIREFPDGNPVNLGRVWNMDTGAAYDGKITIMNIDTKEFVQSDPLFELYPEEMGRNREFLAKKKNV